jgi:uncharacterized phiE125 gp8 family phage protein
VYGLKLVTPPTEQPVTLDEAKKQVEIASSVTYHDDHLLRLVKAATEQATVRSGRQMLTATWRLSLDDFPADRISLPMPPLQSVSSITYYDANGTQQTLATTYYKVLTDLEPGQVVLKWGQDWPTVYDEPGSVSITFLAGEADTAYELGDRHEWFKQAVLLLVQAQWLRDFQQPYERIERAAEMILESHRCGDDFVKYGDE